MTVVQVQHLVITARGGDDLAQELPICRRGSHFLFQFSLGGDEGFLARLPLSGGDLLQYHAVLFCFPRLLRIL